MRKPEPTNNLLFDRFWEAYPRKEAKPKAQRAFAKLKVTEELLNVMLEAIRQQAKVKCWDRPELRKYIPHPATWLNNRRWEDEIIGADTQPATAAPTAPTGAEAPGCCTILE